MSLPDSGWLEKIERAPPRVLLSVVVATGCVWFLDFSKPEWLDGVLAAGCVGTATLLVANIAAMFWRSVRTWRAERLMRSFDELSEEQANLLRAVFTQRSREFDLRNDVASRRWFEELIIWNYVNRVPMWTGSTNQRRTVTEKGWQELGRRLNR